MSASRSSMKRNYSSSIGHVSGRKHKRARSKSPISLDANDSSARAALCRSLFGDDGDDDDCSVLTQLSEFNKAVGESYSNCASSKLNNSSYYSFENCKFSPTKNLNNGVCNRMPESASNCNFVCSQPSTSIANQSENLACNASRKKVKSKLKAKQNSSNQIEKVKRTGSASSTSSYSELCESDNDTLQLVRTLDKHLELKAQQYNLSAPNVKSILHHMIKSEHTLSYVRQLLGTGDASSKDAVDPLAALKLTRSKARQLEIAASESTPVKSASNQGKIVFNRSTTKSILDFDFDDDSNDSDYHPAEDSDSEISSFTTTPKNVSNWLNVSPFFNERTLVGHLYQSPNRLDTPVPSMLALDKSGPCTRQRTLGLENNWSWEEQEKRIIQVDPDAKTIAIEESRQLPSCDVDTAIYWDWLRDITATDSLPKTKMSRSCASKSFDVDDPDSDPDFYFDPNSEQVDNEDFRSDRSTKIPEREVVALINDLLEGMPQGQGSSSIDVDKILNAENGYNCDAYVDTASLMNIRREDLLLGWALGSSSSFALREQLTSNGVINSTHAHQNNVIDSNVLKSRRLASNGFCDDSLLLPDSVIPRFNLQQFQQLAQQMRQHVQLLVQVHELSCFENNEVAKNNARLTRMWLKSLNELRLRSSVLGDRSAFATLNLRSAIVTLQADKLSVDCVKEPECCNVRENRRSQDGGKSKTRKRLSDVVLSAPRLQTMKSLANCSALIYPDLLPEFNLWTSLSSSKPMRAHFFPSEDKLLAQGLSQFKHLKHSDSLLALQQHLLPAHDINSISNRIRNLCMASKGMNEVKQVFRGLKLQSPPFLLLPIDSTCAKPPLHWSDAIPVPQWLVCFRHNCYGHRTHRCGSKGIVSSRRGGRPKRPDSQPNVSLEYISSPDIPRPMSLPANNVNSSISSLYLISGSNALESSPLTPKVALPRLTCASTPLPSKKQLLHENNVIDYTEKVNLPRKETELFDCRNETFNALCNTEVGEPINSNAIFAEIDNLNCQKTPEKRKIISSNIQTNCNGRTSYFEQKHTSKISRTLNHQFIRKAAESLGAASGGYNKLTSSPFKKSPLKWALDYQRKISPKKHYFSSPCKSAAKDAAGAHPDGISPRLRKKRGRIQREQDAISTAQQMLQPEILSKMLSELLCKELLSAFALQSSRLSAIENLIRQTEMGQTEMACALVELICSKPVPPSIRHLLRIFSACLPREVAAELGLRSCQQRYFEALRLLIAVDAYVREIVSPVAAKQLRNKARHCENEQQLHDLLKENLASHPLIWKQLERILPNSRHHVEPGAQFEEIRFEEALNESDLNFEVLRMSAAAQTDVNILGTRKCVCQCHLENGSLQRNRHCPSCGIKIIEGVVHVLHPEIGRFVEAELHCIDSATATPHKQTSSPTRELLPAAPAFDLGLDAQQNIAAAVSNQLSDNAAVLDNALPVDSADSSSLGVFLRGAEGERMMLDSDGVSKDIVTSVGSNGVEFEEAEDAWLLNSLCTFSPQKICELAPTHLQKSRQQVEARLKFLLQLLNESSD